MKKILMGLHCLFLSFILQGQNCPLYQKYVDNGDVELKKGDFKKAIQHFSNAMIHCPEKAAEVRAKILLAFEAIDALKKRAENDRTQAKNAQQKAEEAANDAKIAQQKAEKAANDERMAQAEAQKRAKEAELARDSTKYALLQTDSARRKAQAVLDKIYFYNDTLGLAYDKRVRKFGFIDRNLNTKIDFEYDEVIPFDRYGFANVKRDRNLQISFILLERGAESTSYSTKKTLLQDNNGTQMKGKIVSDNYYYNDTSSLVGVGFSVSLSPKPFEVSLKAPKPFEFDSTSKYDGIMGFDEHEHVFANIKKQLNKYQVGVSYLLDAQGNEYKLATNMTHLDSTITALDLREKGLTEIPSLVFKNTQLKILLLDENQLSSLPPELGQLTHLTHLYLSDNQLNNLPSELGNLVQLTELHLSNNELSSLPSAIGQLPQLVKLDLRNNGLSILSPELGKWVHLTHLDLAGNQLNSLPPELGQLTKLTHLYLAGNQLNSLPPELGKLNKLIHLYLNNNQLSSLPIELGKLANLKGLKLSNNQLSSLPPELGQLTQLTGLNLAQNRLSSLPPELEKLTQLAQLNLFFNPISKAEQEKIKKLLPKCDIGF